MFPFDEDEIGSGLGSAGGCGCFCFCFFLGFDLEDVVEEVVGVGMGVEPWFKVWEKRRMWETPRGPDIEM
jgi:hypothetical protein